METQSTETKKKWYDYNAVVIILCFIFFPVGLYGLWKGKMSKGAKIGLTIAVSFFVLIAISNDKNKKASADTNTTDVVVSATPPAPVLTQAQRDSIEKETYRRKLSVAIDERQGRTITAANLIGNYTNNEVKADQDFKGQSFYVEGTVGDIRKDILDNIFVTLQSSDVIREVQCYFDDASTASRLQRGMRVTFYGKCDGLMMNVLMKDCKLVANLKDMEKELAKFKK